jgi:hypothetical protein
MQVAVQTQYVAGRVHGPDSTLPQPFNNHVTLRLPNDVANRTLANAGIKALLAVTVDDAVLYFAGVFVGGGSETRIRKGEDGEERIVVAAPEFCLFTKADVKAGDNGIIVLVRKNEPSYNLATLLEKANGPLSVLVPIKNNDII